MSDYFNNSTSVDANYPSPAPITNEYWSLFVSLVSISAICLLVTIVLHLMISEKHNCHGWTQFSYLVSLFLFDFVFIPALSPGLTTGNDRNILCFSLAVVNQYFFICAKTWLIIISFDLFCIIRKMKIIAKSSNKNLKRFALYSMLGWAFPFLFVLTGVTLNRRNREYLVFKNTDDGLWAQIPDYGFQHCRIPNWFIWECFVFTNCLFHLSMFIIISITIFRQRRSASATLSEMGSNTGKSSPLLMLVKLFVVVGLSWSYIAAQDLLRAGNINTKQSWGWHVFRCIYFLQGAFISVITLSNNRIRRSLVIKYPKLQGVYKVLGISFYQKLIENIQWINRKESLQSNDSRRTVDTEC